MVTFVIIRHGCSQFNKERRFSGHTDVPLDEAGVAQAEQTCRYVAESFKIDKVYSSDLCRARDTAKPLADALGLPVITRADLREIDLGRWEGRLIDEVEKEDPEAYALYKSSPGAAAAHGGESRADLMARAANALREIAGENDGKTVAVATHNGFICALCCVLTHTPVERMLEVPPVPNASVTVVRYDSGSGSAEFVQTGYDGHLSAGAAGK